VPLAPARSTVPEAGCQDRLQIGDAFPRGYSAGPGEIAGAHFPGHQTDFGLWPAGRDRTPVKGERVEDTVAFAALDQELEDHAVNLVSVKARARPTVALTHQADQVPRQFF
jgi:hypothetical protein